MLLDYSESNNSEEKKNLWNKFNKHLPQLNDNSDKELKKQNDSSKSIKNNSTLSLHISAYENSNESKIDIYDSGSNTSDLNKTFKNAKPILIGLLKTVIQNPFEFARQQENDENKVPPEIAQFKASQKLISPYEKISDGEIRSNDEEEKNEVFLQSNVPSDSQNVIHSRYNNDIQRSRFHSGYNQSSRTHERKVMSPDSSSRRSHESNEGGSSRSRKRSNSITNKRRKYSPSSRRSRSNSPSRNTSSSRRKYHDSSSANGRSPTRSSRRSPEHHSSRKRSYRPSYSSHHRRSRSRSPLPSSSRRESDRYHRTSNNRKPSPPAERRDNRKVKNDVRSHSPRSPRRPKPISSSSDSSPSPSPPPIPVKSETIETKNEIAAVTQAASTIEIKSDTNEFLFSTTMGSSISQPPMPPPIPPQLPLQPQLPFSFNYPPPPFFMPQLGGMYYPPGAPPPQFMFPFTPPPPPPPPPIPVEEEAPGTSLAIPVPIQSSKYLYMPERPK
uniref:Uncharacterized protein n=1 Tax=Panagrolaimus davidi TaxID=227884 RepID=A0A914PPC3_9BILA